AVTYPDFSVQEYIKKRFVPVRFNVVAKPEVMDRFNASWTPTIIVEDVRGREHRRSVGYLDPKRFLGELALAWLKDAVDRRDFSTGRAFTG
ncbi:MAG: thioredoxin family protein, partial [Chloroflexi bacterium]|nr:thioredoxin family protein [Chloroflexota bacterium]